MPSTTSSPKPKTKSNSAAAQEDLLRGADINANETTKGKSKIHLGSGSGSHSRVKPETESSLGREEEVEQEEEEDDDAAGEREVDLDVDAVTRASRNEVELSQAKEQMQKQTQKPEPEPGRPGNGDRQSKLISSLVHPRGHGRGTKRKRQRLDRERSFERGERSSVSVEDEDKEAVEEAEAENTDLVVESEAGPSQRSNGLSDGKNATKVEDRVESNKAKNVVVKGLVKASEKDPATSIASQLKARVQQFADKEELALLREQVTQLQREVNHKNATISAQEEIVERIQESLTCTICYELLTDPQVLNPCGHVACAACLVTWFKSVNCLMKPLREGWGVEYVEERIRSRSKCCFTCRSVVQAKPVPQYILKDLIAATKLQLRAVTGECSGSDSHQDRNENEAAVVAQPSAPFDVTIWERLFQDLTRDKWYRDEYDIGLKKCGRCHFELDSPECGNCGEIYSDLESEFDDEEQGMEFPWMEGSEASELTDEEEDYIRRLDNDPEWPPPGPVTVGDIPDPDGLDHLRFRARIDHHARTDGYARPPRYRPIQLDHRMRWNNGGPDEDDEEDAESAGSLNDWLDDEDDAEREIEDPDVEPIDLDWFDGDEEGDEEGSEADREMQRRRGPIFISDDDEHFHQDSDVSDDDDRFNSHDEHSRLRALVAARRRRIGSDGPPEIRPPRRFYVRAADLIQSEEEEEEIMTSNSPRRGRDELSAYGRTDHEDRRRGAGEYSRAIPRRPAPDDRRGRSHAVINISDEDEDEDEDEGIKDDQDNHEASNHGAPRRATKESLHLSDDASEAEEDVDDWNDHRRGAQRVGRSSRYSHPVSSEDET